MSDLNGSSLKTRFYISLFLLSLTFSLQAHPLLMGGASGAGDPTFDGVLANPATGADFDTHHASFSYAPQYKMQEIRYPGFPSNENNSTNFANLPTGGGVYRVNDLIAVGMSIPIPGLKAKIEFEDLPLNILGQKTDVDIEADGQLLKLEGFMSYKFMPKLRFGLLVGYENTDADVMIYDSPSKEEVAPVTVKITKLRLRLGVAYRVHPKVDLGFATTVFQQDSNEFKAEIISGINDNESASGDPEVTRILAKTIATIAVKVSPHFLFIGEIEYNPKPDEKRLSIVDFKEQPIDGEMSVGGRLGAKYSYANLGVYLGGAYEPTTIGPGTTGKTNDTTGYGFFDFNLAGLLGQNIKPFWLVGGGFEYKFKPVRTRAMKKPATMNNEDYMKYQAKKYMAGVKFGLVYQQTSVGIDNSGEQPAAYVQRLFHFPISLYYNFY